MRKKAPQPRRDTPKPPQTPTAPASGEPLHPKYSHPKGSQRMGHPAGDSRDTQVLSVKPLNHSGTSQKTFFPLPNLHGSSTKRNPLSPKPP